MKKGFWIFWNRLWITRIRVLRPNQDERASLELIGPFEDLEDEINNFQGKNKDENVSLEFLGGKIVRKSVFEFFGTI